MLFQVLCGFEPIFYTTHPNEEPNISTTQISIPSANKEKVVFTMPQNVTKEDVQYIFDALKIILSRQYGINV